MREWRNRQTRTFEGRVVIPYGFKSRLSHHKKGTSKEVLFLWFNEINPLRGFVKYPSGVKYAFGV